MLRAKADEGRTQRERTQALKLKTAYENMVKFEAQRDQDRKEREDFKMIARK